jgi:hypothetical protein
MTTKEIIQGMLEGKKYTSSKWSNDMHIHYITDSSNPFQYRDDIGAEGITNWRTIVDCPETFSEYVKPIEDKALIWCWDTEDVSLKFLMFYDAENERAFRYNGSRDGDIYTNYLIIDNLSEYPQDFQDMVERMRMKLDE